jgi:hypothetical protein
VLIIECKKMFSAGSTISVHGKNASPRVINCSITNSETVGINDNEQVTCSPFV